FPPIQRRFDSDFADWTGIWIRILVMESMNGSDRGKTHQVGEAPRPIKIYDCQNPHSRHAVHTRLGGILTYPARRANGEMVGRRITSFHN
ncbi:MAG: hypothetical protein AB1690_06115, partial [Candidatus Zixiibacteriota bacterium]